MLKFDINVELLTEFKHVGEITFASRDLRGPLG